jgi:hypothetical protein
MKSISVNGSRKSTIPKPFPPKNKSSDGKRQTAAKTLVKDGPGHQRLPAADNKSW